VTVLLENQAPIANAGPDQTLLIGNLVTLNGSGSQDPDDGPGPLSYEWVQIGGPSVSLSNPTTSAPSFTPAVIGTYTFSLVVRDGQADSTPDAVVIKVNDPTTTLVLNDNRFMVQVDWLTSTGSSGQGTAVALTSDSGYFWFFENTNVELLVKILDGRGVNGHFWVFYGALTDIEYTITVTDTQTGAVKTYQGQQGHQQSGNDVNAFADSGQSSESLNPQAEEAKFAALMQLLRKNSTEDGILPQQSSTPLYLNSNRFKVDVNWLTPTGSSGEGTAVPLTSDSGYFWFFENTNVELLVKIHNGCGVNSHYWFFYGALTDVAYTITVTDTETNEVKTYPGYQHIQTSSNDVNAFACP
jgi:hypothetical protein